MMTHLSAELTLWQDQGLTPRLWLRDDDAVAATPALTRLIRLVERYQIPVLLAVIPQPAEASLAQAIAGTPLMTPCQHGFRHRNHASPGDKAVEMGGQCGVADVENDIILGRDQLAALFGKKIAPILVPPWNRIEANVVDRLPGLGFQALSTFGSPRFPQSADLREINSHVDLIDWRKGRAGKTAERLDEELAQAFALARAEGGREVGLLAHHLAHDAAAWDFLERFYDQAATRGLIRFIGITDML